MRRSQFDCGSQPVQNLSTNPSFETAGSTVTTYTNIAQNPSFETTSGTVDVRTNLFTNPAFESTSGTTETRVNLITNPTFEGASGVSTVRANFIPNPSMEASSGTPTIRTNLMTNPAAAVNMTGWATYGGAQSHAELTTTRNAAAWSSSGWAYRVQGSATSTPTMAEIGIGDYTAAVGTTFTVSVYVLGSSARKVRFRGRSVGGGVDVFSEDVTLSTTTPTRVSLTATVPAGATGIGFSIKDIAIPTPFGASDWIEASMALVEHTNQLLPYFDGTEPAHENISKSGASGVNGLTTSDVTYAGSSWKRGTVPINNVGGMFRCYADVVDMRQGEPITVSVTVANDQATVQQVVLDVQDTGSQTFQIQPGETRRIAATGTRKLHDSTFRFGDLAVQASGTETRSILVKDWLIETGTTAGDHYTGTGDFTYAWTGTANASTSIQKAVAGVASWFQASTSQPYQSSTHKYSGTKSIGVLTKGGYGDGIYAADIGSIVAGASYTFSAWVKTTTADPLTVDFRWKESNGTIISDSLIVVPAVVGEWTRVTATATAPTGTPTVSLLQPMLRIYAAHTGTTFYVDNVLVERASAMLDYFDGGTGAAGDFTYAWSGTVNNSISFQQAPAITGWTNRWFGNSGGHGALYQAKGGLSGTYARKVWTSANTGATMDAGISPIAEVVVAANTTYTLSAWVRTSVSQTYNFYIVWRQDGTNIGQTPTNFNVAVPANQWTRVSITGVSPAGTNGAAPIIGPYSGGLTMPAGSTMDFDNVLFEASPVVRPYFDGSEPIQNLVANPSFETDTVGWAGKGSTLPTLFRDTSKNWRGVGSLKVTMTSNTIAQGAGISISGLTVGKTYTMSGYVWVPTGTADVLPTIAGIGYGQGTGALKDQWVRCTMTFVATLTTHNVGFDLGSGYINKFFWIDAVMLNAGDTALPYIEGTDGFTYLWAGTAHASRSVQQASKLATIGDANQAVAYRVGSPGNYKGRIFFTNNTIGDSGINFSGGITTGASKTYTVSVVLTSPINRTVKFSAQGAGVVPQSSGNISLTAGVPSRQTWSFTTTASGSYAIYILRSDLLLDTLDFDHMIIEEGPSQIGGYFDGTRVDANLVANPNFEIDTTGWVANTGTPTLTASTDRAFLGTKSLKAVNTLTSGDIAVMFSAALQASRTYTLSYWVYTPDARSAVYFDVSASNFNVSRAGERAVPANTWTKISATFTTTDNMFGGVAFYLHHGGGPTAVGSMIYVDAVLLEESFVQNQYYEGAGDFTYHWTGTAHASTSVQRGVAVSRASSERAYGVSTTRNGDKVLRVIPVVKGIGAPYVGDDVFINLWSQPTTLKANTTYTVIGVYQNEAPLSLGPKFRFNVDGIDQSTTPQPTTVGEHTIRWQYTTGANASVAFLRFMPGPSGVAGYTNEVILKGFMMVEGVYGGPYFDGTTVAQDLTYAWTGTAHNSTSIQRVTYLTDVGNSGPAFAIQSSDWSSSGSKSVRIITTATGEPEVGLNTAKMQFGKTYTVMAKLRINKVATGVTVRGRRINFYHSNNNQQSFTSVVGTTSPNAVGIYQHRLVFKIPADTTHIYLRLGGHSAAPFEADAYWDDVMIVEGDYAGDYVDGTKPLAKWTGAANASTSIGYPPQFLDIAGTPMAATYSESQNLVPISGDPFSDCTVYLAYEAYGEAAEWTSLASIGGWVGGAADYNTKGAFTYGRRNGGNLWTSHTRFGTLANSNQSALGSTMPGPVQGFKPSRHVVAIQLTDGASIVRHVLNGGTEATFGMQPGNGIAREAIKMRAGVSNTDGTASTAAKGLALLYFPGRHSAETRLAMSRYLGNKYGANVA